MSKTMLSLIALVAIGSSSVVTANDAVLMEFSSDNCPPCRAMRGVVSELIAQGVPIRQINVAAEPHQARRYGVRSTPTYLVLRNGREVSRLTGMQDIATLRNALQVTDRGPLVPTRSRSAELQRPHTRLAPIGRLQDRSFDQSASRAIRQPAAPDQTWRDITPVRQTNPTQEPLSESLPSTTLADAIERAKAATVRLRVFDGRGYGAGTGTIIDSQGDEALVLTCGHLFRDTHGNPETANSPDNRIEVDLFIGGKPRTVTGQLIDFDAGDRDIGLVAIRPGVSIQPVDVLSDQQSVRVGQTAFSFGCDRGDPPTRRDTRVTGVDKYNQNIGASNIEIDGAPIDGRSGGGLFDEQGRLVGVCNAADYKSDIGIYTGPRSVYWQLDRVRLAKLYQAPPGVTPQASVAAVQPPSHREPQPVQPAPEVNASASEMIVILRDRNGSVQQQVLTLNQPDAELVRQIRQAALRR